MPADAEMVTTPSGIKVVFNHGNHRYQVAKNGEKLMYVPSVTTILGATLPKNLSGWAERGAVEGVLKVLTEEDPTRYPPESWTVDETLTLMQEHKLRWWQRREAAALRGTSIHSAFETLSDGVVPKLSSFPLHERPYLQALLKWWSDVEPEIELSEVILASHSHAYAGRTDVVAKVDGRRGIIDLKTSKSVYDSHHFQLKAYELALAESGYGTVDFGAILRVGDDGTYQFVESWASGSQFLALLHSYEAQKAFERATPAEFKRTRKKAA